MSDLYNDYCEYEGSKDIRKNLHTNKFGKDIMKCI